MILVTLIYSLMQIVTVVKLVDFHGFMDNITQRARLQMMEN